MKNALNDLKILGWSNFNHFIKRAKHRYSKRWEDLHVGAASFLDCQGQRNKTISYYRSLSEFVHEVNHLIGFKCLYLASEDKFQCDLKEDSSLTSLQSLHPRTDFPKKWRKKIESVQVNYLHNAKEADDPTLLFDELNSYRNDLEIKILVMKKEGKNAILSKKGFLSLESSFLALYDLVRRYHEHRLVKGESYRNSRESLFLQSLLNKSSLTFNQVMAEYKKLGMANIEAIGIQVQVWKLLSQ